MQFDVYQEQVLGGGEQRGKLTDMRAIMVVSQPCDTDARSTSNCTDVFGNEQWSTVMSYSTQARWKRLFVDSILHLLSHERENEVLEKRI